MNSPGVPDKLLQLAAIRDSGLPDGAWLRMVTQLDPDPVCRLETLDRTPPHEVVRPRELPFRPGNRRPVYEGLAQEGNLNPSDS